jgi:hypothetical protein
MKYEIIDNFMPQEFINNLWTTVTSQQFPWYYGGKTNFQNSENDVPFLDQKDNLDDYHFIHHFYNHDSPSSVFFESLIIPILSRLDVKSCLRIKANWHPRTEKIFENHWHKDFPFEHNGAVYYINSNDGFTIFEDGTKIESISNRLLLFESHILHRSTTCTNAKGRFNINFNYF